MTNESRILTVSYGTFSCTLEGFDDPFNTMKAIAEYFRDLAAEDRYFGAEPLQPDAAMLHRVADREVSRLVGAKVREAGLALRKSDVDAAEDRLAGRSATINPEEVPVTIAEPPVVEPALQAEMPTGVAAKLARIRQAASRPLDENDALPGLPEDILNAFREEVEGAASAPAPGPASETTLAWAEPIDKPAADTAISIGALLQDPEAEAVDQVSEDNIFADLSVAESAHEAAPALIEAGDRAPFIEAGDYEAELQEASASAPVRLTPAVRAEEELVADVVIDMPAFDETVTEEIVPLHDAAFDSYQDDSVETVKSFAAEVTEAEALQDAPVEPYAETATATEVASETATAQAGFVDDYVEDHVEDMPVDRLSVEDLTPEDQSAAEPDEIAAPLPAARASARMQRVTSRIVRIHAEDDLATTPPSRAATRMVSPDEAEDLARLLRQADDVMADEENRRRLDSLAHLKAAVAAAEADRAAGDTIRSSGAPDDEAYREDLSQVVLPDTDTDQAEVRPRRASVWVRPREPRPGTNRPGLVSPPPLVLVSEQRVDRILPASETPHSAGPAAWAPAPAPTNGPSQPGIEGQPMSAVRTGRLTGAIGIGASVASLLLQTDGVMLNRATPGPATDTDEEEIDEQLSSSVEAGLATFAERVGAKSIAEMLEAAAAYATWVERRELFTRPQLMRRLIASAGGNPISREDGLRSFGTLLRTGRIEKVGRGHYVLAEQSPYLAEARRFR